MVPFWKEAMEMVLDVEPGAFPPTPELSSISLPNDLIDEDSAKIPDVSIVEASAELLYGLVHQRYVLTRAGLHAMVSEFIIVVVIMNSKRSQAEKYEAGVFGSCPRVYCVGCNVVPCGRSDLPGLETVKLFCPNCNDIYVPASSRFQGVDGMFPSSAKYFFNGCWLLYQALSLALHSLIYSSKLIENSCLLRSGNSHRLQALCRRPGHHAA